MLMERGRVPASARIIYQAWNSRVAVAVAVVIVVVVVVVVIVVSDLSCRRILAVSLRPGSTSSIEPFPFEEHRRPEDDEPPPLLAVLLFDL
ncbi:hypothetical protein CSUB01_03639 [Colletotrichum sublineola]|uniref:Uncharacterized protein n=1 Tax=Colletotrichum sublineola TaxID=1173701 RepID=A0A066XH83_COLSU|nr:hypothetical protein CSUB01_03639 [Colletotrichum sublineola]